MEPVKGGTLADVPREARDLMEAHAPGMTPASWAVRFAASREGVIMVLSGMSDYNQYSLFGEKSNSRGYYQNYAGRYGKAGDCIGCRRCEAICPQHLPVV